jgi:phosphate transport system permease protein
VKTLVERANQLRRRIEHLEREEIGSINYRIEKARLARHALTLSGRLDPGDAEKDQRLLDQITALERDYLAKTEALERLHKEAGQEVSVLDALHRPVGAALSRSGVGRQPAERDALG